MNTFILKTSLKEVLLYDILLKNNVQNKEIYFERFFEKVYIHYLKNKQFLFIHWNSIYMIKSISKLILKFNQI